MMGGVLRVGVSTLNTKRTSEDRAFEEVRRELPASVERWLFLITLVGAVILNLLLLGPFIRGEIYAYNDLLTYHLPIRVFYAHCLEKGESFLWSPFMFCGFYLQGEGQAGMTHPLHWLLYKMLPFHAAFGLEFFLSYPFMLVGMYLLLRRWKLPSYAAMIGGITFAFSGFNMLHYIHLNVVAILAHIPWLMLLADLALRGTHPLRVALARLGLVTLVASLLLLGHPHFAWYCGLALGAYLLLLGPAYWKWKRMCGLALAGMTGFLVGAVQWLPTLDLLKESVRSNATLLFRLRYSLHPVRLTEMLIPQMFFNREHEFAVYTGVVTLLLAIVVLIRWKCLETYRRTAKWALIVAGVGILLALGRHGVVYRAVAMLPVVGSFRCPSRFVYFAHLALAILAAIGIRELARVCYCRGGIAQRHCWPLLIPLLVTILVAYLALIVAPGIDPNWDSPFSLSIAASSRIIISTAVMMVAVLLVYLAITGRRIVLVAVILLLLLDHGYYGATYIYSRKRIKASMLKNIAAQSPLSNMPPNRLLLTIGSNQHTVSGVRLADGEAGLTPKTTVGESIDSLRIAGVANVNDGHRVPTWLERTPKSNEEGWIIPNPLPRARLVTNAVRSENPTKDMQNVDIDNTVLLDRNLELSSGQHGLARIREDRPGKISLEVQAGGREVLVVSERFHNGWQANVDGKPTPIMPAYGIFMAIPLERGKHVVELTFCPRSFVLGRRITILGSLFSLLYLGLSVGLWRFRKRDGLTPNSDLSCSA